MKKYLAIDERSLITLLSHTIFHPEDLEAKTQNKYFFLKTNPFPVSAEIEKMAVWLDGEQLNSRWMKTYVNIIFGPYVPGSFSIMIHDEISSVIDMKNPNLPEIAKRVVEYHLNMTQPRYKHFIEKELKGIQLKQIYMDKEGVSFEFYASVSRVFQHFARKMIAPPEKKGQLGHVFFAQNKRAKNFT